MEIAISVTTLLILFLLTRSALRAKQPSDQDSRDLIPIPVKASEPKKKIRAEPLERLCRC